MIDFRYFKQDLKHFLVNLHLTLFTLIFYAKYGFYGWSHLLSVVIIQCSIFPLDDWMDHERSFPFYILPSLLYAFYNYPLITVLAMAGNLIANIRVLLKKSNFFLERFEGIGDVPIYVTPNALPIGLNSLGLYIAATLFILFVDSFHKIGHRETANPKLMWLTGLIFAILVAGIYAKPNLVFRSLLGAILVSLIPFYLIKKRVYAWAYTQVWLGFSGLIGFYYYLAYFG